MIYDFGHKVSKFDLLKTKIYEVISRFSVENIFTESGNEDFINKR